MVEREILMVELVNATGGGDLGRELDLEAIANDIEADVVRYQPEHWPGLYLRFRSNSPTVLMFRTGKFNIAGAKSIDDLSNTHNELLSVLDDMGLPTTTSDFEIRNLVFLGGYDKKLRLEQVAVILGLTETEYEPEQFPGVVYKPKGKQQTYIIFQTGKVILTGVKEHSQASKHFEALFEKISGAINGD